MQKAICVIGLSKCQSKSIANCSTVGTFEICLRINNVCIHSRHIGTNKTRRYERKRNTNRKKSENMGLWSSKLVSFTILRCVLSSGIVVTVWVRIQCGYHFGLDTLRPKSRHVWYFGFKVHRLDI